MVTQQPELAIDADGQPIDIPPEVVAWRVRRVKGPGRPGLAHDLMGRPITLPITATFQDLYDAVGSGKYIVDPIDELGRHCKEVTSGVTGMIQPQIAEDPEPSPRSSTRNSSNPANQDVVHALLDKLIQTVDAHTKIAELVVSRIPSIIESAAGLVTAADGAKLPARTPPPMPPEPPPAEYDDEQPEPPAMPDESLFRQVLSEGMKAFASTMAEKLGASISSIPLSALLDWSKAAPTAKPAAPTRQAPPAAPRPSWTQPAWSPPPTWEPSPAPRTPEPSWYAAGPPEPLSWEPPPPVYGGPPPSAPHVVAVPVVSDPMPPVGLVDSAPVVSAPVVAVPVTPAPVVSVPVAPVPMMSAPVASGPIAPARAVSVPVAHAPVMTAPAVSVPMESAPVASVQRATAPVSVVPVDTATGAVAMASSSAPSGVRSMPAGAAGLRDSGGQRAPARRPDQTSMAPTAPTAPKRRNDTTALAPRSPPTMQPRTSMDDSVPVTAHVMQVYQALTEDERTYVQQLIGHLTHDEKAQWLMELASLSIPDAVARVRDVIRPRLIPPPGGKNGVPS